MLAPKVHILVPKVHIFAPKVHTLVPKVDIAAAKVTVACAHLVKVAAGSRLSSAVLSLPSACRSFAFPDSCTHPYVTSAIAEVTSFIA
eukprot:1727114-Rhodomonas_salina.1